MKDHVKLNITITNIMKIVIVWSEYNALYFTYPHKNTILAIFCRLICFLSPSVAGIGQFFSLFVIADGQRRFQPSFTKF